MAWQLYECIRLGQDMSRLTNIIFWSAPLCLIKPLESLSNGFVTNWSYNFYFECARGCSIHIWNAAGATFFSPLWHEDFICFTPPPPQLWIVWKPVMAFTQCNSSFMINHSRSRYIGNAHIAAHYKCASNWESARTVSDKKKAPWSEKFLCSLLTSRWVQLTF